MLAGMFAARQRNKMFAFRLPKHCPELSNSNIFLGLFLSRIYKWHTSHAREPQKALRGILAKNNMIVLLVTTSQWITGKKIEQRLDLEVSNTFTSANNIVTHLSF
jgi:hypothetical protein